MRGKARNVANNHLRALARTPLEVPLTEDVPAGSVTSDLEAEERLALALDLVARHGGLDGEILRSSLVNGLTPVEIGKTLHMSSALVRTRKSRAARRLGAEIGALSQRDGPMR